jgi:hypothetical protein
MRLFGTMVDYFAPYQWVSTDISSVGHMRFGTTTANTEHYEEGQDTFLTLFIFNM